MAPAVEKINDLEDAFPIYFDATLRWGLLFRCYVIERIYNLYELRIDEASRRLFREKIQRQFDKKQMNYFKKRAKYHHRKEESLIDWVRLAVSYQNFMDWGKIARKGMRWTTDIPINFKLLINDYIIEPPLNLIRFGASVIIFPFKIPYLIISYCCKEIMSSKFYFHIFIDKNMRVPVGLENTRSKSVWVRPRGFLFDMKMMLS